MNAAGIAEAGPVGPAPASPTRLVESPSVLGYRRPRHEVDEDSLPHGSDSRSYLRGARTPAGSTSRPGGPFQPVARRGFGMPRIGASVLRRRRFGLGVRG